MAGGLITPDELRRIADEKEMEKAQEALEKNRKAGERSPEIRERLCRRAPPGSALLDPAANRAGGPRISATGSKVLVYAVPTDEEQMIARHKLAVLGRAPTAGAAS